MTPCAAAIHGEIAAAGGMLPFVRFMELALYHPQSGYYTRPGPSPVGKSGDFVTSVALGPIFGRILARQVDALRTELGAPENFCVVEYGAHRGALRDHIRAALPGLIYQTIDVGDAEPAAITGCVLANEFLDALPVHRVLARDGAWHEWYVTGDGRGGFVWRAGPLSTPRLAEALADLPVAHMRTYTTEVNLRALDWIDNVARRLMRGMILVCDYGFERHEFFAPHRATGTLTCYRNHQRGDNPLLDPGEQDITAHVEFTSLIARAERAGLRMETFTDQGRYLLKTGQDLIRALVEQEAGRFSALRATLNELTHPAMMGRAFRVLALRKD